MKLLIILLARLSSFCISFLKLGSGSTWPGHIALALHKNFVHDIMAGNQVKLILIAGTNGKTTTSKLIRFLLEKNGKTVFQNEEGANLLNGIASTLIRNADMTGCINAEYGIFEVDENTLPQVLSQVKPAAIILLNLFRDQLDRYGEVNSIALRWKESLKQLTPDTTLLLNGDDPQIYYLGKETPANVVYFGLPDSQMEQKEIPHDVDSVYCPNCGHKLQYNKMSYSHLGDFWCNNCGFKREHVETFAHEQIVYPLKGQYNIYNINAALLVLTRVCQLPMPSLLAHLPAFKPAFGRQEQFMYQDRHVFLLLSKNPTGFNQSIQTVRQTFPDPQDTIIMILNDRIPDGRDISWIWDVEFEEVVQTGKKIVVTGDRTYDMAIRMMYCFEKKPVLHEDRADGEVHGETGASTLQSATVTSEVSNTSRRSKMTFEQISAVEELKSAVEEAVTLTPVGKNIIILTTYSGMLDVRELLVGRRLL